VTSPDDSSEFENWFQSVTWDSDEPDDDPGEVSPANRRWLRGYFDANGPVPANVVWDAFLAYKIALANDALAAVLADLDRTSAFHATVLVDTYEDVIRITVNDGYTTPSMRAVDRPEAFAEVAGYFQEQTDQELRCWPVCADHDVGLHPEVHDGAAMWWCRLGDHGVSAIGALGLAQ